MKNSFGQLRIRLLAIAVFALASAGPPSTHAQDRPKLRISNASYTMTALPLLAAKEWGLFTHNGLDVELILMQSSIVPAALTRGDIDYQAGVGPASVNATLSGFATRAIWFSSDKISYWLMAQPQFKTLESLKSRKIAITGLGGTVHVASIWRWKKPAPIPETLSWCRCRDSRFNTSFPWSRATSTPRCSLLR